jgi:malonyl-CoA decarboxylase
MPDEPLIFVEVALVSGIAGNIHALLDEAAPVGNPNDADSAIFYSISNCQQGLVGISFGDFLIKRVVDALAAELPRLKNFATLSPIPGFRNWLKAEAERGGLLLTGEAKALQSLGIDFANGDAERPLLALMERADWHRDQRTAAALREPLLRLAARYLVHARAPSGRALDPVAHFHLTNGARVERLNWLGDVSEKGLTQSAGIMVNYLYRQGDIEANHEAYRDEHQVAASSAVRNLARTA